MDNATAVSECTIRRPIVDLISAVRELNGLASQDLNKLLKDSDNFTVQCKSEKGLLRQIDVEKLASSLPLHLMAILLPPDKNIRMAHLLCGLRLLHTLSDIATRHARLEQILLDDVKFSEKILDLVFFTSIVLAHRKQDNHLGATPVLHCAVIASSFHLLTNFISSQWHDLVHVLLAHPKVDIFMDVAFDAVSEGIRILDITLQTLNNDVLCTKVSLSSAERTANYISQQCEASLQFLLSLCQQKSFRDRVLRNKELCKQGGILRLAYAILKLNVPNCFKESSDLLPAISRLKAKVLSILLQLCEAESISYLDEVAGSPKGMYLAKLVALEFLELLKCTYKREVQQPSDSHFRSSPMGFVLLNALHLADIFSDDSNFRSFFMTTTIPVLVELFAVPDDEFKSNWCSLRLLTIEEDGNLEYDAFAAAGIALLSLNEGYESAQTMPFILTGANSSCSLNFNIVPSSTYAQQRTSCLVKIIANLHVFVPNMCEEEERDLFVNKFFEHLRVEFIESTQCTSSFGSQKAATICRNLSCLSQFATSLTPIFLNDEDVHLVSVFADKLQKLTCVHVGEDPVQESSVKNEIQHIKPEEVCHLQQSSMSWTKVPSSNFGRSHQDTKDFIASSPSVVRALDESFEEDSLKLHCNDADPKMEDEKAENGQSEEKQPKKRKRNIMSENQIFVIETALQDEPEMQRNAALLQSWADKLSSQGPEITSSQLKNWLNNRKARLARAAKEVRASSEGDTSYPDKPSGPGISNMYDSPESAGEELYVTPARGGSHQSLLRSASIMTRAMSIDNAETTPQSEFVHGNQPNCSSGITSLEPGLDVSLVDTEGKLIGTGKTFQAEGRWQGRTLNSGICIVDITELKIDKGMEVQHPSEAAGRTFEEAVARNEGVMRVAWDTARIFQLHQ